MQERATERSNNSIHPHWIEMEPFGMEHPWFAIYVKPRHEKVISRALRHMGYEEFLPLYSQKGESRTSELPLFTGYVFCRFDINRRLPILQIPGVFFVVGTGKAPTPVNNEEIISLRTLTALGLNPQPWPFLEAGQQVKIKSGPLSGVQGLIIRHKTSDRLVVSVTLLRRSVAVEIDRSSVMRATVGQRAQGLGNEQITLQHARSATHRPAVNGFNPTRLYVAPGEADLER